MAAPRSQHKQEQQQDEFRVTSKDGDLGVLTHKPLDLDSIQRSLVSTSSGAVVTFVRVFLRCSCSTYRTQKLSGEMRVSQAGYTRDSFHGRTVTHLSYETYVPVALKALARSLESVRLLPAPLPRHDVAQCCEPHRHKHHDQGEGEGDTSPGDDDGTVERIDVLGATVYHLLGDAPPLVPTIVVCVASQHRASAFAACEALLEAVKRDVPVWKREWYADGSVFQGQDGQAPPLSSLPSSSWKENFPPPAAEVS